MKAVLELDFESEKMAKKAAQLLEREELNGKSSVELKAAGKKVVAEVAAERFALLRARVTVLLRNAKIVYDSIELIEGKKED